jgi:hypothetical protein
VLYTSNYNINYIIITFSKVLIEIKNIVISVSDEFIAIESVEYILFSIFNTLDDKILSHFNKIKLILKL